MGLLSIILRYKKIIIAYSNNGENPMKVKFQFLLMILIIPIALVCCTPQGLETEQISIEGKGETAAAYTMVAVLTQYAFETLEYKLTEIALQPTDTPEPPKRTNTPMTFPQTSTPIPYYTPAGAYCDWARYIKDVTIPDGTALAPGETFIKTWRFENIGSCTWTTGYGLVNTGGDAMDAARHTPLSVTVVPTNTVDISVELTAPNIPGDYLGLWNLSNESGELFGIGDDAKGIFWVKIRVKDPDQENIQLSLNMGENFCTAAWSSSTGALSCPSTASLTNGSVNLIYNPTIEGGQSSNLATIVTVPSNGDGGYISGRFPPLLISEGDYLTTTIGCLSDYPTCDVIFEIRYRDDAGNEVLLGSWGQIQDGYNHEVYLDLTSLTGMPIEFIFNVLNNGTSEDDRAFWLFPAVWHR
jgi:hypothetical protein